MPQTSSNHTTTVVLSSQMLRTEVTTGFGVDAAKASGGIHTTRPVRIQVHSDQCSILYSYLQYLNISVP